MAAIRDPHGVVWTVNRRWWPFPGVFDVIDVAFFGWIGVVFALPFLLLWPFWLLTKFIGARWKIVIVRDGRELEPELVRGWRRSRERIRAIARNLQSGAGVSGPIMI